MHPAKPITDETVSAVSRCVFMGCVPLLGRDRDPRGPSRATAAPADTRWWIRRASLAPAARPTATPPGLDTAWCERAHVHVRFAGSVAPHEASRVPARL